MISPSQELVNCGECYSVPRSSCNYCDGQGGPASVDSVATGDASSLQPLLVTAVAGAMALL